MPKRPNQTQAQYFGSLALRREADAEIKEQAAFDLERRGEVRFYDAGHFAASGLVLAALVREGIAETLNEQFRLSEAETRKMARAIAAGRVAT